MSERSRARRVTYGQLEQLWELLDANKDVALGYNKTAQARDYSRRMWEEVATALNSHGDGACKDGKGWSKYWVDYKSKLKKLAAATRTSRQKTGGGPADVKPLSAVDEKFMSILGSDYGSGLPGARVEPFDDMQQDNMESGTLDVSMAPIATTSYEEPGPSCVSEAPLTTTGYEEPGPSCVTEAPLLENLTEHLRTQYMSPLNRPGKKMPAARAETPLRTPRSRGRPSLRQLTPRRSPRLHPAPPQAEDSPHRQLGLENPDSLPAPRSPHRRRRLRRDSTMTVEASRRALVDSSNRRAEIEEQRNNILDTRLRELIEAVREQRHDSLNNRLQQLTEAVLEQNVLLRARLLERLPGDDLGPH